MLWKSEEAPFIQHVRNPIRPLAILVLGLLIGALEAAASEKSARVPRLTLSGGSQHLSTVALHGTASDARIVPGPHPAIDPGLRDGEPIYFDVEPATIPLKRLQRGGPIRLKNLMILGDHPRIEFALRFGGTWRSFDRRDRLTVDGAVVSVFDAVFPREDLFSDGPPPMRFDHIGRPVGDTTAFLRLRPSTIPKTRIVKINNRVQYSSHVVNIVIPYDGMSVFSLPGRQIAAEFYQHFADSYHELAFVPERFYWSPCCGARHEFVYQDVGGIGIDQMNDRALYGGTTMLRDWIFYIRGDLQSNYLSVHETGHNWSWFISLFDAAGLNVQGPSECAGLEFDGSSVHAPLMGDEHIFMSHCIYSPSYLAREDDGLRIRKAQPPLTFHPLTLYAMGLVGKDEVPPMYVSASQGAPAGSTPGTRIPGELTEVTIDDVVRTHGARSGPPVPPVWRRAMIVVSPERLLSKNDLRWFNFWAKRISDPDVTGIESLAGVPSLEVATRGMVDVRTEVFPRDHPQIPGDFSVSYPTLGKRDIPGLKLKRNLVSRFEIGQSYRIEGKVQLAGSHETVDLLIGSRLFSAEIKSNRRFSLEVKLKKGQRGRYWMTIGLDRSLALGRIAPVSVE